MSIFFMTLPMDPERYLYYTKKIKNIAKYGKVWFYFCFKNLENYSSGGYTFVFLKWT